jgi:hypothetical protein
MKTITVRLENVTLDGPKMSKANKEYYFLHLEANGQKYTMIQNDSDIKESVGDLVNIAYETKVNGKFTNNQAKKVEILPDQGQGNGGTSNEAFDNSLKVSTTTYTKATILPNKDISMEVSGLLQALINSGEYSARDNNLEADLRLLLNIKRKIAAELEATGRV